MIRAFLYLNLRPHECGSQWPIVLVFIQIKFIRPCLYLNLRPLECGSQWPIVLVFIQIKCIRPVLDLNLRPHESQWPMVNGLFLSRSNVFAHYWNRTCDLMSDTLCYPGSFQFQEQIDDYSSTSSPRLFWCGPNRLSHFFLWRERNECRTVLSGSLTQRGDGWGGQRARAKRVPKSSLLTPTCTALLGLLHFNLKGLSTLRADWTVVYILIGPRHCFR